MRVAFCAAVGLILLAGCGGPAAQPSPSPTSRAPGPPAATPTATRTTPVGPGPTPTESVATGSVTPTATATPLRLTGDQAAKLLIAPSDLPTPYQVDPFVSPDAKMGMPPGCAVLDGFGRTLVFAPVRAARGFVGGPAGPFLEQRVAVLPGGAADAVAQLTRAVSSCRTFDSRDADGVTVRFTLTPLVLISASSQPAAESSDQIVAVTMSGRPAQTGVLVSQALAVRRGDVVVAFVFSGMNQLDPEVLQAAVARAVRTLDAF